MILLKEHNTWFMEDPVKTGIIINGRNIDKYKLQENDFYTVAPIKNNQEKMYVRVIDKKALDKTYITYDIIKCRELKIGGMASNQIELKDPLFLNEFCCSIVKSKSGYTVTDIKSSKFKQKRCREFVYVNQRRVYGDYDLKDQDKITIHGVDIIFHFGTIVKRIDEEAYIEVSNTTVDVQIHDLKQCEREQKIANDEDLYEIQGRLTSQIDDKEIIIKAPNKVGEKPDINWVTVLMPPAIMAFVYIVVMPMLNSNYRNGMMFVVFSSLAVITSIINYISQIYKYKKNTIKRVKDYERYLNVMKIELTNYHEQEKQLLFLNHGDYASCYQSIMERNRNLWERSYFHKDFLTLKVGVGDTHTHTKIITPEIDPLEAEPDHLLVKANDLGNQYKTLQDVPITIDLKKETVVSLTGERMNVENIIRSLVTETISKHSYEEVKLVFIMNEQQKEKWEWIRWVPHIWDQSKQHRYIATTKEEAKLMLTSIHDIVKARIGDENKNTMNTMFLPHYVFIVFDRDIIRNNPMVSTLVAPESESGISSIFALENTDWVPQHCKVEIRTDYLKGELIRNGIKNNSSVFVTEEIDIPQMERLVQSIAPVRLKEMGRNMEVPSRISLFETLGIDDIDQLDIESLWLGNKSYESLKTPIGVKSGGERFYFDIHEKEHGPHGLVAGTTGSGKSETLLAYLVSLAMNYHPHYVSYIIIDYKGGGMINELEGLPHLLGGITNLDDNEINRSLLSLRSELKRRQRMFDTYKINHIDAYQKMFKDGVAREPMPHLLLIVDEFAELKADQPEFMKELISAARIGRSLGLHLILATQKPSGVVNEQIWSNSKFKLCLKVSTPEDSREVLKRADASYITLPGRAYLQVGNDELFELFQSAYGGVEYSQNEEQEDQSVYIVNLTGRKDKIYPKQLDFLDKGTKVTQLKKLVEVIEKEASNCQIEPLESLWKLPLKERYDLVDYCNQKSSNYKSNEYAIPIGIYDHPGNQEQGVYYLSLVNMGSVVLYGAATMGKTTALETIALSYIRTYNPKDIHLYMVDFGSRILSIFEKSNQVGGVVLSEETDRLERLVDFLTQQLSLRKDKFTEAGVTNLEAYNDYSEEHLPALITLIDNIGYVREIEEIDYISILSRLIREGMNYGIYFIVTAGDAQSVPSKLRNVLSTSIALHMNDSSDYRDVISTTIDVEPVKVQGRGIAPYHQHYVEMQFFQPELGDKEFEITQNIKDTLDQYNRGENDNNIFVIKRLEKEIYMNDFVESKRSDSEIDDLLVGLDMKDLDIRALKLQEFGGFLINGKRKGGLSNLFAMIITQIGQIKKEAKNSKIKLYIFDNFFKELNGLELYANEYIDLREVNSSTLEQLAQDVEDESFRTIIMIHDYSYFEKIPSDSLKNTIVDAIQQGLYTKCNVFIGVQETGINGFDSFSNAVKKIDSGIVLGNSDYELNQLGIKVSFEAKKELMRPGQGYIKSDRYDEKIQVFFQQDEYEEVIVDEESVG